MTPEEQFNREQRATEFFTKNLNSVYFEYDTNRIDINRKIIYKRYYDGDFMEWEHDKNGKIMFEYCFFKYTLRIFFSNIIIK